MVASDDSLTAIRLETRTSRALGHGAWVYLFDGVLIDTGFAHARTALLRALDGRRVERIAHTHVHEDHIGNDAALRAAFGATVLAPRSTLHLLADPARLNLLFYEHLVWGQPEPCPAARPLGDAVETLGGRLEVVPTPGHSPDHVVFFEPERRWVFCGDLFLGAKVRAARPFENVTDLAESLRRVLALRPARLFCAHRGAIDEPARALETKLRFLESLREQVVELDRAGLSTGAIATRMLGREVLLQWVLTGGDFSRSHLVRACLKPPGAGYRQPGSISY
jgi:glyoxylase-like metal-dependent hydrolase (beta-lactamase superfamily II)